MITKKQEETAKDFVDTLWQLGYRHYDSMGFFRDEFDNQKQDVANAYKLAALILKDKEDFLKSDYIASGNNFKRYPDLLITSMMALFAEQRDARIELIKALQDDVLQTAHDEITELFQLKFDSVINDAYYDADDAADRAYEMARDCGADYLNNVNI